jgi:hypothetical protein
MDMEGNDHGLVEDTVPTLTTGTEGKTAYTANKIAVVCAKIRAPHITNTADKPCRLIQLALPGIGLYNNNSVARVSERTVPTERPPLVGEDSADF